MALLAIDGKVILNQNAQVAQLPEADAPCPNGMNLVTSGWGAYATWGDSVPYFDYGSIMLGKLPHKFLWAVKQKCVDIEQCNNLIKNFNVTIDDSLICVVEPGTDGINGALFGDSGGA